MGIPGRGIKHVQAWKCERTFPVLGMARLAGLRVLGEMQTGGKAREATRLGRKGIGAG